MSADPETVAVFPLPEADAASIDGDLLAAAEALADGTWPPSHLPASARSACLSELQIIHGVQRAHRVASREEDVAPRDPSLAGDGAPPSAESSASLGEAFSRARPTTERPELSSARRWGPLFVLEKVGSGSFGEVHRAWDPALEREVALKIVRLPDPGTHASTVVREGQLLAQVRHDSVISVYGAAQIDGEVGIWMEFVRGRTLEQIVREDGPMSAQEATVVAESLCSALAAVHARGLLHRDIKAANVMRAEGGRYVLIDFGTGVEIDGTADSVQRMAGTPLYMAPEVLAGAPATEQSDIYSIGIVLFFLVTGTFPVYGRTLQEVRAAHRHDRRVAVAQVRPGLPISFDRAIEVATAPVRANRFGRVHLLSEALAGQGGPSLRLGPFAVASRALLWIAAGLMVLAALGFISTVTYRAGAPARDSFVQWPVWGLRSIVAPLVLTALCLAVVLLSRAVFGVVAWLIARITDGRVEVRSLEAVTGRLLGAMCGPAGMQIVLLAQIVGFALLLYRFRALLIAIGEFGTRVSVSDLGALRPDNNAEHQSFRMTLTVYFVACSYLWGRVFTSTRSHWFPGKRGIAACAVAGLAMTLLLLSAPYRVVYQNTAERVMYQGQVCYLLDVSDADVVLFCPVASTRVRTARPGDIQRTGHVESIFAPLDRLVSQN